MAYKLKAMDKEIEALADDDPMFEEFKDYKLSCGKKISPAHVMREWEERKMNKFIDEKMETLYEILGSIPRFLRDENKPHLYSREDGPKSDAGSKKHVSSDSPKIVRSTKPKVHFNDAIKTELPRSGSSLGITTELSNVRTPPKGISYSSALKMADKASINTSAAELLDETIKTYETNIHHSAVSEQDINLPTTKIKSSENDKSLSGSVSRQNKDSSVRSMTPENARTDRRSGMVR